MFLTFIIKGTDDGLHNTNLYILADPYGPSLGVRIVYTALVLVLSFTTYQIAG